MQATRAGGLPEVDPSSAEHSAACVAFIRERLREAGGTLSFAEYMHYALYAPGLGYYSAGATKFGAAGDFVTAPEISPLFGRVVARQCAEVLAALGSASILELGAGSGRLAIDVLGKLADLDRLPEEYLILEVSADLAERQQKAIAAERPDLADRVRWLEQLPESHRGVILANEVLDALPAERFVRRDTLRQLRVRAAGNGFEFVEAEAPAVLRAAVATIESDLGGPLADGYTSEVSLAAPGFVADVLAPLTDGVALFFDYGFARREYYSPDRLRGTLRCHFRHHAHDDPLILAGIQDITAWVDFTTIASAGIDAGASVAGFTNQAAFLLAGGLDAEFAGAGTADGARRFELSRQVKMLTLPGEMGERFKCLGLTRGAVPIPPALAASDRSHSL